MPTETDEKTEELSKSKCADMIAASIYIDHLVHKRPEKFTNLFPLSSFMTQAVAEGGDEQEDMKAYEVNLVSLANIAATENNYHKWPSMQNAHLGGFLALTIHTVHHEIYSGEDVEKRASVALPLSQSQYEAFKIVKKHINLDKEVPLLYDNYTMQYSVKIPIDYEFFERPYFSKIVEIVNNMKFPVCDNHLLPSLPKIDVDERMLQFPGLQDSETVSRLINSAAKYLSITS